MKQSERLVVMESLNSISFRHFDTLCTVTADVGEDALEETERLCDKFERLFSRFDPRSSLSQVNAARGHWVDVESELAEAVSTALGYCELTAGLFDVTMGSVCKLWDFKQGIVPSEDDIDAALAHVGWWKVRVDGDRVRIVDPQASIDLGGVAKGIIADALAAFLVQDAGATIGCINLGGNVLVIGSKPDGQPWNVGLRAPIASPSPVRATPPERDRNASHNPSQPVPSSFGPAAPSTFAQATPLEQGRDSSDSFAYTTSPGFARAPTFAAVAVRDKSVVTSGIYERAFAYGGQLLHHILDPRTGGPAVTDVLSATVISETSTDADGLTTALVIMGSRHALEFVEGLSGIEAVLLAADGAVLRTSGVRGDGNQFYVK